MDDDFTFTVVPLQNGRFFELKVGRAGERITHTLRRIDLMELINRMDQAMRAHPDKGLTSDG